MKKAIKKIWKERHDNLALSVVFYFLVGISGLVCSNLIGRLFLFILKQSKEFIFIDLNIPTDLFITQNLIFSAIGFIVFICAFFVLIMFTGICFVIVVTVSDIVEIISFNNKHGGINKIADEIIYYIKNFTDHKIIDLLNIEFVREYNQYHELNYECNHILAPEYDYKTIYIYNYYIRNIPKSFFDKTPVNLHDDLKVALLKKIELLLDIEIIIEDESLITVDYMEENLKSLC